MPAISYLPVAAVVARLSDSSLGYHAMIAAAVLRYPGIEASTVDVTDFSATSPHFLQGNVDITALDQSSEFEYPVIGVCAGPIENSNDTLGATFGGLIPVQIRIFLSWEQGQALPNFEMYRQCVEDAMFAAFNTNPLQQQVSSGPSGSNGGFSCSGRLRLDPTPVQFGGQSWRQALVFTQQFRALVP